MANKIQKIAKNISYKCQRIACNSFWIVCNNTFKQRTFNVAEKLHIVKCCIGILREDLSIPLIGENLRAIIIRFASCFAQHFLTGFLVSHQITLPEKRDIFRRFIDGSTCCLEIAGILKHAIINQRIEQKHTISVFQDRLENLGIGALRFKLLACRWLFKESENRRFIFIKREPMRRFDNGLTVDLLRGVADRVEHFGKYRLVLKKRLQVRCGPCCSSAEQGIPHVFRDEQPCEINLVFDINRSAVTQNNLHKVRLAVGVFTGDLFKEVREKELAEKTWVAHNIIPIVG